MVQRHEWPMSAIKDHAMFYSTRKTWDDLTPQEQIAECERAADVLRRSRDAADCAGDVVREAAYWDRLAAEIRAAS